MTIGRLALIVVAVSLMLVGVFAVRRWLRKPPTDAGQVQILDPEKVGSEPHPKLIDPSRHPQLASERLLPVLPAPPLVSGSPPLVAPIDPATGRPVVVPAPDPSLPLPPLPKGAPLPPPPPPVRGEFGR